MLSKTNYKINASLIFENNPYTKKQILSKIEHYKEIFKEKQISENDLIVIKLSRTPELVAIILAALQSKITFCLLDIHTPESRQKEAISAASLMITEKNDKQLELISLVPKQQYDFSEVAYLLYTSGTSGSPKGVMVTYEGLENFIKAMSKCIPFNKGKTIVSFTNCSFDIFMLETVFAMVNGINIVLATEEQCHNPVKMKKLLEISNADILQMTPTMIKMVQSVDYDLLCLKKMKVILVGGEPFPQSLLINMQKNLQAKIFNVYGPTETTIWSTVAELTNTSEITVGFPILHTKIFIVSKENKILRVGGIGEICIGGKGLAKGYLFNDELTKEKFSELPEATERVYHTGDLGVINANRELICLGRMDNQIKINGHRIELEDIDMNLMAVQGVINAMTCFDKERNKLISFLKVEKEIQDSSFVRQFIATKVPSYMLPNQYVIVDKLLYTSSGKADRNGMLKTWNDKCQEKPFVHANPKEVREQILCMIMQQCNISEDILVDSSEMSLEEIGMDSISFISLVLEIEDRYDIEFDAKKLDINAFTSIKALVDYLESIL